MCHGRTVVNLDGITLTLRKPRPVAAESVGHCWFPDLLRFSTGEFMLNYSLNDDANTNLANTQAVRISTDGGKTFDFAYDVNGFHNGGGEVRLSLPSGEIIGVSTFLKPDTPGQWRRFAAHYWKYANGGRQYTVEPWAVKVEGLPRDVEPFPERSRTWWARINWFGDIVDLDDGQFVTTLSLRWQGDPLETTVALVSQDQGRHWEYLSTVSGPEDVPEATEGFDEPCLIRLEDGDLMCVSRVGQGQGQKLARSYSADGGRTWSALDRLPAYSVAPQMCRLENGVLALSTGRPGVFLWLSTDRRGKEWQPLDILAYHNSVLDDGTQIQDVPTSDGRLVRTTSYTALVEASSNRLFLVYDRIPLGWLPVPAESGETSRIYLLEMEVRRT